MLKIFNKNKINIALLATFLGLLATGCADKNKTAVKQIPTKKSQSAFDTAYNSFNIEKLKEHIKFISSDKFAGREPATAGGKMTTDFLVKEFKALGLKPGIGDSYLQPVPLVSIESKPTKNLKIADLEFDFLKNYVANSRKTQKETALNDSEIIFAGYGINAPEYQWNDYKNIDVKGKTVVVLVNDPGYASQDPELFNGNTMTYYGRWIYKYEEAARQDAAGVIIVHETKPASYGWNIIESSWSGAQYHLPAKEVNEPAVDVEMWLSIDKTKELFAKAGFDFEAVKKSALSKNFQAFPLKLKASISLQNTIKESVSNNVVATIPGSEQSDEHVLYMAHWDHLGTTVIDGKVEVFNGAHDNATGMAGIIQVAKAFQSLDKAPKRSVTMIAVTAEEQGRLGSRYYANHPVIPLNKTVGLINMDGLNATGMKKDVTVVGYGKSELEEVLAQAAKRQNRVLVPESTPERGYYYRSDHFSLAKKGVPALSAGGGQTPLNAAEAKIAEVVGPMLRNCYHQICDEYNESFGWKGMIADIQMFFETGYILANSDQWPGWKEGSEFKVTRDKMMKAKQ